MTKSLTEADKVARLRDYYSPQAERILKEVRKQEEGRLGRVLAERYAHDTHATFARAFVAKCTIDAELAPTVRGFKAPLMIVYNIRRAINDRQLWRKLEEDIVTMGKRKATLKFCTALCRAAGAVAFTEAMHQVLLELSLMVRGIGAVGATALAAVGVEVIYMAISALQGCDFNAGQAMKTLIDKLAATGWGTVAAAPLSGIALPAIVAGVLIGLVCGVILPSMYSNMDTKITWREFFVGILEALGLKSPPPDEEYVTDGDLHAVLHDHGNSLLCPIGLVLMQHPVSLHGMAFEYEWVKRHVMETGRDVTNTYPAALAEIVPIPALKTLIDELVAEFEIDLVQILHCNR